MSDSEKVTRGAQEQGAKEESAGPENSILPQSTQDGTQQHDGLSSMKTYDSAYGMQAQFTPGHPRPSQPLDQRKASVWSPATVPLGPAHPVQAPTPGGHLSHLMLMGSQGMAVPNRGITHPSYAYSSGYATPGMADPMHPHMGSQMYGNMQRGSKAFMDDNADSGGMGTQGGRSSVTGETEKARLRVNKACERCRGHKVKCSGSQPCTNCVKHNVECVFRTAGQISASTSSALGNTAAAGTGTMSSVQSSDEKGSTAATSIPDHNYDISAPPRKKQRSVFTPDPSNNQGYYDVRGPPTPNYQSHALPLTQKNYADPSYTAYLENRVHYLENILSDHSDGPVKNVGRINPDTSDVADLMRHTASKWRSSRRHQNALVIELCKALYEGLDPEAKAKVTVPRTQYFGWNMSGCNYLKPEPLPSLPDMRLLNEATKAHYVDFFFKEINPLYAILHETVFREQIVAFNKQSGGSSHPTNVTALFSAMLCLVYALSNRYIQFMKPDGPSMEMLRFEERLFKYSYKVVSIFTFEWESFELIQCWLLVTLYLRTSHRQTAANNAFGHAISMCRSMGLMRDRKVTADVSTYDLLKAKRIFFSIYCFDRIMFLQAGRYRALNEFDIIRPYPSFDFVKESAGDDWITLPAFAMIHIARISNFLHKNSSDNYDLLKSQQINKEIYLLQGWLSENGFDDVHDIFPYEGCGGPVSHMVKAVVKLHFYDLLLAIHGKLLFNYFGKRLASEGMKVEKIVEANEGVIYLLNKLKNANCLYAPWYINLLLLFNVGINCLVFINAGVFLVESRRLMKDAMSLLHTLQNSPVKNDKGKLIFHERFKMVKECIWVFKMTNKIMSLSFKKSLADIEQLGTDPGSDDVNKQYFTQFGLSKEKNKDDLEKLMEDQREREFQEQVKGNNEQQSPGTVISQPESDAFDNDNFLGNLQWFDQWLDFNQDL